MPTIPVLKITDASTPGNVAAINNWAQQVQAAINSLESSVSVAQQSASVAKAAAGGISPSTIIPPDPVSFSVSETGYVIDGVLYCQVTASYTAPTPLSGFAGIFLVIQGYRGSSTLVKVNEDNFTGAAGGSQSFNTTLQRTGETVTLYAVAKNSSELARADWAGAPSKTVTLNGNATAPNAPTGLIATSVATGVLLEWNENAELNLQGYNIYRNTSNVFAGSTKLGQAPTTRTGSPSFVDKSGTGGASYFYFVTAVNTAGLESSPSTSATAAIGTLDMVANGNSSWSRNVQALPNPGVATWYKIGTWTSDVGHQGSHFSLELVTSNGYSGGLPSAILQVMGTQQNYATGAPANNLQSTQAAYGTTSVLSIAIYPVGGSAPSATAWDFYAELPAFPGNGQAEVFVPPGTSWSWSMASASPPSGYFSPGLTYGVPLLNYLAGAGVPYNFKGAWNSATAYVQGDEVSDQSYYWLCLVANTNSRPSLSNVNWQILGAAVPNINPTTGLATTTSIQANAVNSNLSASQTPAVTVGTGQTLLVSATINTNGGYVEPFARIFFGNLTNSTQGYNAFLYKGDNTGTLLDQSPLGFIPAIVGAFVCVTLGWPDTSPAASQLYSVYADAGAVSAVEAERINLILDDRQR